MARKWWLALVTVVSMGVGAGCSDGGRPRAASEPRDDVITATITEMWAAVGVDAEQVSVGRYGYDFAPDNLACADLATDDRWAGYRRSSVPSGLVDQAELAAAMVAFLEAGGFEVQRYRSTHPESLVRGINAVKDDMRAYSHLSADGGADFTVLAGPCAPSYGRFDPDQYQPEG